MTETMKGMIQVSVNGFLEKVPRETTIAWLIEHLGERDPALIVEHNGRFLFPKQYPTTTVSPHDRVELIHPDFGG